MTPGDPRDNDEFKVDMGWSSHQPHPPTPIHDHAAANGSPLHEPDADPATTDLRTATAKLAAQAHELAQLLTDFAASLESSFATDGPAAAQPLPPSSPASPPPATATPPPGDARLPGVRTEPAVQPGAFPAQGDAPVPQS